MSWLPRKVGRAVADESAAFYLAALGCLVASKAFLVTQASAVPRLLPDGFTLVNANSRISMAKVAGAAVGGGIAAGIAQLGPAWSLRFGFAVFIGATVLAIMLSPKVDSTAGEREFGGVLLLAGPTGDPSAMSDLPFALPISNYWQADVISRASETMAECARVLLPATSPAAPMAAE